MLHSYLLCMKMFANTNFVVVKMRKTAHYSVLESCCIHESNDSHSNFEYSEKATFKTILKPL